MPKLVYYLNNLSLQETSVGLSYDRILRGYESDSNSDQEMDRVRIEKKEKWDCESILSTYSNLYNHPQIIKEPRVSTSLYSANAYTHYNVEDLFVNKFSYM